MAKKITDFIRPKELYKLFGFTLSTQAKYRREKNIPYYKRGGKIFYDKVEIIKWIETGKVV